HLRLRAGYATLSGVPGAAHASGLPSARTLRRQLIPLAVQLDPIQALARGDVQRLALLAAAETDIRRNLRLDVGQLLALRRIDVDARLRLVAHRDIEVAVLIDHQSIRPVLRRVID